MKVIKKKGGKRTKAGSKETDRKHEEGAFKIKQKKGGQTWNIKLQLKEVHSHRAHSDSQNHKNAQPVTETVTPWLCYWLAAKSISF